MFSKFFKFWLSRGRRNRLPIVRNAILALSDKWLSLDTHPKDEQIIIAQMNFINLGQVNIWFRTSADAMLLVRKTSASQISWQTLLGPATFPASSRTLILNMVKSQSVLEAKAGPLVWDQQLETSNFWSGPATFYTFLYKSSVWYFQIPDQDRPLYSRLSPEYWSQSPSEYLWPVTHIVVMCSTGLASFGRPW